MSEYVKAGLLMSVVLGVLLFIAKPTVFADLLSDMNATWTVGETKKAVFDARAALQGWSDVVTETDNTLTEIQKRASFAAVPASVKAELIVMRAAITQSKNLCSSHTVFLQWNQPE